MRKEDDHSNHNVYSSCKYHVVWCPKYRRKVLTPPIDMRLKAIIEEVVSTVGDAPWAIIKQDSEAQKDVSITTKGESGRGARTRTGDLMVPNHAR